MPWYDESLKGPRFVQLFGPVLQALRELGESASRAEVVEKVAELVGATDEELAERLPGGGLRFRNLVSWARFYLTRAGYMDPSRRGIWTFTEKGRTAYLNHEEALRIFKEALARFADRRKEKAIKMVEKSLSRPATRSKVATVGGKKYWASWADCLREGLNASASAC